LLITNKNRTNITFKYIWLKPYFQAKLKTYFKQFGMKTFLLKTGCLFLFSFIFYQSIHTENDTTSPPLLGQEKSVEFVQSKTAISTTDISINDHAGLLTNR